MRFFELNRTVIIIILLLVWVIPNLSQQNKGLPKITEKLNYQSNSLIFISDTQSPIWLETLWLDTNENENMKTKLFQQILNHSPVAVFHFGDLVSKGFNNNDWKEIDAFIANLSKNGIKFYPTLGNHELMFFPEAGEAHFLARFPFYIKTGYQITIDSLSILLLNSNFNYLTKIEILNQTRWFESELLKLDRDPAINFVIVGCHHPPFTNSKIVNPSEEVQRQFIPPYLNTRKAKLFISGHSHAFEHFRISGKDFIVIGGGGALQHPLYSIENSKWIDQYDSSGEKRRFHFTEFNLKDKYNLNVFMVDTLYNNIEKSYHINFP
jgi:hypothetical protein